MTSIDAENNNMTSSEVVDSLKSIKMRMIAIEPEKLTQEKLDSMSINEILETVKGIRDMSNEYLTIMRTYSDNMKLIRDYLANKKVD